MTSDTKSPEEIEREIESERAGLREDLEGLQNKFSYDGIVRQFGDQLREHGGEFGRSVATAARDNPMALALTGIGVAWMIFGNNRGTTVRDARFEHHDDLPHRTDYSRDQTRRPAVDPGMPGAAGRGPAPAAARSTRQYRAASPQPTWARDWDRGELDPSSHDSGSSWSDKASDAAGSARDKASHAADAARSTASGAGDAVRSGAQSVRDRSGHMMHGVRDAAGNVWSSTSHRAEAVSRRVREGTEHLSEEARERIASARARALEARDEASRRLSRSADEAAEFYDTHPLVVGALAFAVGAAVAGALPRSRMEDEYVGEYRDHLFDEAERVYAEEIEKAKKAVKAGVDEARNVASEVKSEVDDAAPGDKSAVEAAGDKAKSAADRVAGAARSKAEEENLGKPEADKKR